LRLSGRPSRSRVDARGAAAFAALAILVFAGSWGVLHSGFYEREQIRDTPVYHQYGQAMAGGAVPYRDFDLEYPPASLPVFVLPTGGEEDLDEPEFRRRFEWVMFASGAGAIVAIAATLAALGASRRRLAAALVFVALAPLALGSVILSRYDLWAAALTAVALAALASQRLKLGHGLLGVAVAAKLYPGVLVPLAVAHAWHRRGRREAAICAGLFVAALGAIYLPFLVLAPDGVWASIDRQLDRPLQIESLGAAVLLVFHHLAGIGLAEHSSHGSQNIAGTTGDVAGAVQSAVQLAGLALVWGIFLRGPQEPERLVRGCATAVVAFIALGKVLSPQFLIWLVPLVPLVRGRRGIAASVLLALALVLTQLWFPFRYWEWVRTFGGGISALVLVRDLVLVGMLAVLVWPLRPGPVPGTGRGESGPARLGAR
jgi:hypothetical protein